MRLRQQAKDDKAKINELQMQVDFAKKLRPGSRKTGSNLCCDRGPG